MHVPYTSGPKNLFTSIGLFAQNVSYYFAFQVTLELLIIYLFIYCAPGKLNRYNTSLWLDVFLTVHHELIIY